MGDRRGRGDRPLGWDELRDRADIAQVGEPGVTLRWPDLSQPPRSSVEFLDRERGLIRAEPIEAFRPAWIGETVRPRRARLRQPVRMEHRGRRVRPLYIWGKDDRFAYSDLSYPWGCVCKIVTDGGGGGSGVIVGPRHVLTASHVVDWATGFSVVEVHRAGGFASGITIADRTLAWTKVGSVGTTTVDEDYAVIVTTDRIGDAFGWLGVKTYDSGWDDEDYWASIGYPQDVADRMFPVFQNRKELDEDELDFGTGRAMTTDADIIDGQSGSPMFGFWTKGPYVVAVVSAEGDGVFSGQENWCSGGSALTSLVKKAREKYP